MLSLIMPAYNAGPFVKDAILSAVDQLPESELEILVCNDGSTDSTAEVVASLRQDVPNLRDFTLTKNQGVSAARNRLLTELNPKSRYVAFMDADDLLAKGALQNGISQLKASQAAAFTMGHCQVVPTDHLALHTPVSPKWPILNSAMLTASVFRTDVIRQTGLFDCSFSHGEDMDYLMRIVEKTKDILFHQDIVFYYRRHASNATNDYATSRSGVLRAMLLHAIRRRTDPTLLDATGVFQKQDPAEVERAIQLYA